MQLERHAGAFGRRLHDLLGGLQMSTMFGNRPRVITLVLLLTAPVILAIQAACGGDTAADCALPQTSCDGKCVKVSNDPANCGACGHVCGPAEVCFSGACTALCKDPQQVCTGTSGPFCTNLQTDNANCGACGTACKPLEKCVAGKCGTGCSTGQTGCVPEGGGAPYCTNVQADGINCGGCNVRCKTLELCNAGACATACSSGQTACTADAGPGYCAKLDTDNFNCGTCGKSCGALEYCAAGACKAGCQQGQTACFPDGGVLLPDGGASPPFCTDLTSDNQHCGACFKPCNGNTPVCISGNCYALDAGPG